jgi:uncharacterized protein YkwD
MLSTLCPLRSPARTPASTGRRVGTATVLLAAATLAALAAPPGRIPPASAASAGPAADYVGRINGLRSGRGLRPLAVDGNLAALAQQHAGEMAGTHDLHHTGNLAAGVTAAWTSLAENVGMGSNIDVVWNSFLTSPHHLANLLDPGMTHVGVGVVDAGGIEWTTHRFMAAGGGAPAPPPPSPPPPPAPPRPAAVRPRPGAAPAPRPAAAPAPAPPGAEAGDPPAGPEPAPPPAAGHGGLERWLTEVAARAVRRTAPAP